jgi:hypothetical protein
MAFPFAHTLIIVIIIITTAPPPPPPPPPMPSDRNVIQESENKLKYENLSI